MMDYLTFKKEVENRIYDYMPEGMKGREVKFPRVDKINRTLDGISIDLGSVAPNARYVPTIYINDMYEIYRQCGDFGAVISMSLLRLQQTVQTDMVELPDMATAKGNIVFQLINTKQNQKLLCGVPNRDFLDLSIIYRWVTQFDEGGIRSMIVTHELANDLGLMEMELFLLAKENTKRLFPPVVKSMNDIVCTLFPSDVFGMIPDGFWDDNLWLLTNERFINGAADILYEDMLHAIAGQLGSDLYIMPSSLHEMLVVPAVLDPHELAGMVSIINREHVDVGERLSDNVYRYDRETRELSLATGMPGKGLEKLGKLWGMTQ